MPAAIGKCHKCGENFSMGSASMRMHSQRDPKRCDYQEPKTYADWEAHQMMTCPRCRLSRMPDSCLQDLDRLIASEKRREPSDSDAFSHYDDPL